MEKPNNLFPGIPNEKATILFDLSPGIENVDYRFLLCQAAQGGYIDLIDIILERGQNDDYDLAISSASMYDQHRAMNYLLYKKINADGYPYLKI